MGHKPWNARWKKRNPYRGSEYMVTLGVTVPKSWKETIEAESLLTDKTVSAVVREILKPWIDQQNKSE